MIKSNKSPRRERQKESSEQYLQDWVPKTRLGRRIKNKEIVSISQVFKQLEPIKEEQIITTLLPKISTEIISVDRIVRMTGSGGRRRMLVTSVALSSGYLGIGMAKGASMFDAVNLANKKAKINIKPVQKGCGAWSCGCGNTQHTIPYKTVGRSGSVTIELSPAPRGTGLAIGEVGIKILSMVGISDIHSRSSGHTRTTKNYALAIVDALNNMNKYDLDRYSHEHEMMKQATQTRKNDQERSEEEHERS